MLSRRFSRSSSGRPDITTHGYRCATRVSHRRVEGRIRAPAGVRTLFLFSFDSRRNSLGQFLAMSGAGFAGTALAVAAWYAWLPSELLATRVARGVGMLSVALTLVLEVPLVAFALLGRGLPSVETFASRRPRA